MGSGSGMVAGSAGAGASGAERAGSLDPSGISKSSALAGELIKPMGNPLILLIHNPSTMNAGIRLFLNRWIG
jgi:hypothetical protein